MEPITLSELRADSRAQALRFLKTLWRGEAAACPICGNPLSLLHRKAKKSDCDWQCVPCKKVFRTVRLLEELNRQMPK